MTIRASVCLAAIVGTLGYFAMGPAHANTSLAATLKASAPIEKILTKAGYFEDGDRYGRCGYERKCYTCCKWVRKRHHHAHRHHRHHKWATHKRYPRYPWRPHYGRNYEIYTYKPPYPDERRSRVQMIYGWYRGYYYPYPYYQGVDY